MFVERILGIACKRLVTIRDDALLVKAAGLLDGRHINLVVACNAAGAMTGVVTKTDIVRQLSHCHGSACNAPVAEVMTREVVSCRSGDVLHDVWLTMRSRGLLHIPIIGENSVPLGVVNARDALLALLEGSEHQEALLRDYVMGVGYH